MPTIFVYKALMYQWKKYDNTWWLTNERGHKTARVSPNFDSEGNLKGFHSVWLHIDGESVVLHDLAESLWQAKEKLRDFSRKTMPVTYPHVYGNMVT